MGVPSKFVSILSNAVKMNNNNEVNTFDDLQF